MKELLTVGRLSDLIGISDRQIQRLVKQKVLKRDKKGKYGEENIKLYIDYLRTNSFKKEDLLKEEIRYKRAQADKSETQNRILVGELVEISQVKNSIANMVINFRSKLNSLPRKLAVVLISRNSVNEIEQLISKEIAIISKELSKNKIKK